MFTVILLMLCGVAAGLCLRNRKSTAIHTVVTLLIWLLLFLLGVEVGGDDILMRSLHTLGLEALLLAAAGTLCSALAASILWRHIEKRDGGSLAPPATASPSVVRALKGSAVIAGFFLLGTACGWLRLLPVSIAGTELSFYALCALMVCVGIGIGQDTQTLKRFRSLNPRLALLPLLTVAGTLAGTAAVSPLLGHRSLTDCLAVGSGFGYYSLSGIFITEYRGVELGTVALLANIAREMITLLGAPFLARWFGRLAPISAGGATTMDTTLPVITQVSGQELVIVSVFHGFVVDFSVPFLVTMWCSL